MYGSVAEGGGRGASGLWLEGRLLGLGLGLGLAWVHIFRQHGETTVLWGGVTEGDPHLGVGIEVGVQVAGVAIGKGGT